MLGAEGGEGGSVGRYEGGGLGSEGVREGAEEGVFLRVGGDRGDGESWLVGVLRGEGDG